MTTMTERIAGSDQHHAARRAASVVLFWMLAAVLVFTIHIRVDPDWPRTGAVATIVTLLGTAYAYTRLVAPRAGISHSLGVGIAWLVLSIATEIAITTRVGHGWYSLLGSPDRPLLRNVFLFVWVFAPALFAWNEDR